MFRKCYCKLLPLLAAFVDRLKGLTNYTIVKNKIIHFLFVLFLNLLSLDLFFLGKTSRKENIGKNYKYMFVFFFLYPFFLEKDFNPFLKSYIEKYARKAIFTEDFKTTLYDFYKDSVRNLSF